MLNETAKLTLEYHDISQRAWSRHHFGQNKWLGDACGCVDDRCVGHHHEHGYPCGCLDVLIEMYRENGGEVR